MTGVREGRQFWTDDREQGRTLGVVLDNPHKPGETVLQYAERVAILAGLMPAGRAAFPANQNLDAPPRLELVGAARLPYREDFE